MALRTPTQWLQQVLQAMGPLYKHPGLGQLGRSEIGQQTCTGMMPAPVILAIGSHSGPETHLMTVPLIVFVGAAPG